MRLNKSEMCEYLGLEIGCFVLGFFGLVWFWFFVCFFGVFLALFFFFFFDKASFPYYLSLRAAAQSKLNNFREAIKDCESAIAIDPKYSKAYGRMG